MFQANGSKNNLVSFRELKDVVRFRGLKHFIRFGELKC